MLPRPRSGAEALHAGAPDYIDATFNLALLLQQKNQYAEAARLLAPLSRYRRPIGMGCSRPAKAAVRQSDAGASHRISVIGVRTGSFPT
jgi:hypothetical protein